VVLRQAALIRDQYAGAGLDSTKAQDWCQDSETHGTGTPAGDPQESSALGAAFFNAAKSGHPEVDILLSWVCQDHHSHTEGTAGPAGLLKAYQTVRHSVTPPNRLFEELSLAKAPFYKHLCPEPTFALAEMMAVMVTLLLGGL
jgi:hybrid polyketide synthase/nonribosomal peptide synthetase ACE1